MTIFEIVLIMKFLEYTTHYFIRTFDGWSGVKLKKKMLYKLLYCNRACSIILNIFCNVLIVCFDLKLIQSREFVKNVLPSLRKLHNFSIR